MELQELAPELFDVLAEEDFETSLKLQGTEFLGHDFRYKFFENIDFDQCCFNQCDMRESSIWMARFGRCMFHMVDFSGTQLSPVNRDMDLFNQIGDPGVKSGITKTMGDEALSTFQGSNFCHVNFSGSFFEEMNFKKIDFEDCNFSLSSGEGAFFNDVVMRQCLFNCANLSFAVFDGAHVKHTKFCKANITGGQWKSAYMLCCDFKEAICVRSNFEGAKLGISKYEDVNFRDCNFKNAEFLFSNFTGARFENCNFENTRIGSLCKFENASFGLSRDNEPDPWSELEYLMSKGKIIAEGGLPRK